MFMIYHKASLFIIIAAYRMWNYFNLKMAIYDTVLGGCAMDIHYHKREDLQLSFISNYMDKSNETSLPDIIYFMMCFKACVRAKVSLFRSMQWSNTDQRRGHIKEANNHFTLAEKYLTML
jgi:aminoglycoside phosphotransferase family enzyme